MNYLKSNSYINYNVKHLFFQVVLKGIGVFIMENYTEMLRDYLQGRRNIGKKLYKYMSRAYRAVEKGMTTWDKVIEIMEVLTNGRHN